MEVMSHRILTALLAAMTLAFAGCGQLTSKPKKQVQVPNSGPPVLTSLELPPNSSPTSQGGASSQEPALISQAAYVRPVPTGESIKPFDQWTEQEAARDALGRIGAAAVPPLVEALRNPDPAVRLKAIEVLGRMGDDAAPAVPDLVRLLNDPDPDVQKSATRTLGRIGPAAQAAVPALMHKLFELPQPEPARVIQ